ncbi:MAG TPA: 3-isopropylmalate dehydratase small subunit [Stellaceae bacterium]|nr:3-isopropylmalate dehydratase small subunit [Stellaceae bacterium]
MEAFRRIDAVAAAMPVPNVDTDQIIPARFLRKSRKDGFGQYLFYDLRFDDGGTENSGFLLNRPELRGAKVLVAERNFGCGSSREHAVYALWDYGFRAVIAPSFGDIFYGNSLKNGFLPIVLPAEAATELRGAIEKAPGAHVAIDLEQQQVTGPDGKTYRFEIDPFRKHCLLKGVDELDFTLGYRDEIAGYEQRASREMSWL